METINSFILLLIRPQLFLRTHKTAVHYGQKVDETKHRNERHKKW